MKTPNLVQKLRAFFSERKFSLRWLAHLSLAELLIICVVLLPSMSVRAGFNDSAGDYDIWVEGGRAGHLFAIQEASDTNSPNHFTGGALWLPGGTRIHGNYNGSAAPNGMIIRDLTTNEVAALPDYSGQIQIPRESWAPTVPNAPRTVSFTIGRDRAWHTLVLSQPDGSTYPVTVDTNSYIWGGYTGDFGSPWPPSETWENMTYFGSATYNPALPFVIQDLSANEQSPLTAC